ncbi:MAG: hypothetical protein MUE60_07415 [Candidatus Eisenbacteria bacterium]|nr:hypothetical protein [Candidatus Eisenbacteria bacterium]
MGRSPRTVAVAAGLLLAGVLVVSCDKDESTNPTDAPELPPASSMVMDFSDFQEAGVARPSLAPASHDNWGWAVLNVAVWNTVLTVTMVVPVASFVEAFNHEPEPQADGSWRWSYGFSAAGVVHTAKLYGRIDLNGTYWDMYISKSGSYTDFRWYTGQTDLAITQGTWTLYQAPETPTPFLGIEWHRTPADSTGDLRYTNIIPSHPDSGGFVHYGLANDLPYNAFYDIHSPSQANTVSIEWNRDTNDGSIRDPHHFGDMSWYCWSSTLDDVVCP